MRLHALIGLLLLTLLPGPARADDYADTIKIFRAAGESGQFFSKSYGYAVFPTIGKGGMVVGAAHGSGPIDCRIPSRAAEPPRRSTAPPPAV